MSHPKRKSLKRLQTEATKRHKDLKSQGVPSKISDMLNLVARENSYPNWDAVLAEDERSRGVQFHLPLPTEQFEEADPPESEITQAALKAVNVVRAVPDQVKLRIARNKAHLVSLGIEFAIFEPTTTGLRKSILDATAPIRDLFEMENFHKYAQQLQGPEHKVSRDAFFAYPDRLDLTSVSLYRPATKKGDPRMWFRKLADYVFATEKTSVVASDQIAVVVYEGSLYLFNLSKFDLKQDNTEALNEIELLLRRMVDADRSIADELIAKLKEIAKYPITTGVAGDTAVGMAVERALGIVANSSKQPDYHGIEIKSGRGGKNRTTLFAQVPDWGLSALKSSAQILDAYGYDRDGDLKLYCTVSTRKANSQGLKFRFDGRNEQLVEIDADNKDVATWPSKLLRDRLTEKHRETFWIEATSEFIDGIEYFKLLSIIHTKEPVESQLIPLVESGVVTMDHLIKRSVKNNRVCEKGPLFKINKRDLHLLFPKPVKIKLS